jgi:hypothetical protein
MIEDGQTIVLGGLIKDEFRDTVRKVPLLGSIPLLGRLFSYTKTQKVKSNLMVFIRPVILEAGGSADHFTSQKYSLIRARQLEAKIGKRGLIRDSAAELPDINVLFAPVPQEFKAKNSRQLQSTEAEPAHLTPPAKPAPAQPVTVTGQPVPQDQSAAAPAAPVTATGQPMQPAATAEQQPAASNGDAEQPKSDVTDLPEIQLSE